MINVSSFLDFYFTKYLFMAGALLGTVKIVKLLVLHKGDSQ